MPTYLNSYRRDNNTSVQCPNVLQHVRECSACRNVLLLDSNRSPIRNGADASSVVYETIINDNLYNAATAAQASMWLTLASIIVMILIRANF